MNNMPYLKEYIPKVDCIKEGVPFLPSWFSGKFHRSTIVLTKKHVPTQTWQNDMEQKTNKASESPVSHW